MVKKRSASLILIPVLFLFACQPTDLDGVGDKQSKVKTVETVAIDKTRDIKGFSNYKELSLLDTRGVNTLAGVTIENLKLNSINLEYMLIKEMLTSINFDKNKSTQETRISDRIKSVHTVTDNSKQDLLYRLIDGKHLYDLKYKVTFDNLEDFEATKKMYDAIILESELPYSTKEVVVKTTSMLKPITYQVHSDGLKHIVLNATNDSYGRYVLSIRFIISSNIDFYLKSEYPSALKNEGVLSVDTLGQYVKTKPTSRLTENFIPQLSDTLAIPLEDYHIETRGTVQESLYTNDLYDVRVLSEKGYVVYVRVSFLGGKLSSGHYDNVLTSISEGLGVRETKKYTSETDREITEYSDGKDTLVTDRSFSKGGESRFYFMNNEESNRFIEYQLLRGLGSSYMNYR